MVKYHNIWFDELVSFMGADDDDVNMSSFSIYFNGCTYDRNLILTRVSGCLTKTRE